MLMTCQKKVTLTVLLLGCMFPFVLPAAAKKKPLLKGQLVVPTQYGNFVFENLSLTHGPEVHATFKEAEVPVDLVGTLRNNTDRGWRVLSFRVRFHDKSGSVFKEENLDKVHDIGKGKTTRVACRASLSVQYRLFRRPQREEVADFDIVFDKEASFYDSRYVFSLLKPKESKNLLFEDDKISLAFAVTTTEIRFVLQNKTDGPITIDWDQVAFVDLSGKSHRVIHGGTKLADRDKPQARTVVPPTARMEDMIWAADYVELVGTEWVQNPILPSSHLAVNYKGQTFSVFMPLDLDGQRKNYLFTIEITDVEI